MNKVELIFNNTKIGFHFGLGFLGELLENLDCSIEDLQENIRKNPFKVIPVLMHTSYSYNLKRSGKDVLLNSYDFIDLIDNAGGVSSESVSLFLNAFTDSMTKDVPVAKNKIPTKKKILPKR